MNSSVMQPMFAAQLESFGLDRTATIQEAATIIADLSEQLSALEAKVKDYDERQNALLEEVVYYKRLVDEAFACAEMALNAGLQMKQVTEQQLPKQLEHVAETAIETQRRFLAFENAQKKLAADPKQRAKDEIRGRWTDWHLENPHHYSDNTDFADVMQKEFSDVLDSVVQITQWCGEWSKELVLRCWTKRQRPPVTAEEKNAFAADMKQRIKTLRPHDVIRWCNEFEKASNSAS